MSTPTGHLHSRVTPPRIGRVGPEPSVNLLDEVTGLLGGHGAKDLGGRTSEGACASRPSEAASGAREGVTPPL